LSCNLFDGISQDDLLPEERDFVLAEKSMVFSRDTAEVAGISSSSVPIYFLEAAPGRINVEVRSETIAAAIDSCNQVFRELARHNVGEAASFSVGVSKALPIVAAALPSVEELPSMLTGIQVDSVGVIANLYKVDSVPSSSSSIVISERSETDVAVCGGIRLSALDKEFIRAIDQCINASNDSLDDTVTFIYSFLERNNDDAVSLLGEEYCSAELAQRISEDTFHYLTLLNNYYFEVEDVSLMEKSDTLSCASVDDYESS